MKVLIISEVQEDADLIGSSIKNIHNELEIIVVTDETTAMDLITIDGPYAFLVIDTELTNCDPDQLAKNLIDLAGDRPIIFFGNNTSLLSKISSETLELNPYNDKFTRPLNRDDFLEDINRISNQALSWVKKEEFGTSIEEINPDEFVPMKIKSFYLYNEFPYDIYLEMTSTQYIKIISANRPYAISTLSSYARKNIRYLFIRKDDQLKYLDEEANKCLKALKRTTPMAEDVYVILLRSMTITHQYMLALGVSPTVLTITTAIADTIIMVNNHQKNLKTILTSYPHCYEGIASKSLLTALISGSLCKLMGWDSETTKRKLVLASILQDFLLPEESLSKINRDNDPRLDDFSNEYISAYLEHPTKTAQIAQQFTTYPDIDSLIQSHHELPSRKGFPNTPPISKLTALNAVFNISQFYAAEVDGYGYSPSLNKKVFRLMNKDFNLGSFKEPLKLLKSALTPSN